MERLSMTRPFSSLLQNLTYQWHTLPQCPFWAKATLTLLLTSLSAFYTLTLITDFHEWKAMGAGGVPHNLPGFLAITLLGFFRSTDTTSLEPYRKAEEYAPGWAQASQAEREQARKSFLKQPLQKRNGQRTRALKFVAPQRQRKEGYYQNPKVKEAYTKAFRSLATSFSEQGLIDIRPSVLEGGSSDAIFLKSNIQPRTLALTTQGEICHIHSSDLSAHVTLSLADAEAVVALGWGERHRLSGSRFLGLGYTMLYIPRTVEEVEVFAGILRAGVKFMSSGRRDASGSGSDGDDVKEAKGG